MKANTVNNPHRRANPKPEDGDEDPYSNQGKLDFLRGPGGEKDRLTIWKAARGALPGTGAGGLVEGWLDDVQ